MIKVEMSDLPVEKIKKIRDWLDKEESGWLENAVNAEIARLQCEATNQPLTRPHLLIDKGEVPADALAALNDAAYLQIFLDVLKQMRDKETKFQSAKLTA